MGQAFVGSGTLHRTAVAAILLLGLTLRVAWVTWQPTDSNSLRDLPDQKEYIALGQNLCSGEGMRFHDARFGQDVYAYRTPGYPFFVALFHAKPQAIRLAQAALDTSTILAIYLLARRWLGVKAGLIASSLVAFNPFLIYFSGTILSETLFTSLLTWGVLFLTTESRLMGLVLLAVSVLVRPSAIFLPAGLALVNPRKGRPGPRTWFFLAIALTMGVLLPWAYRNQRVLGQWVWTTTNGGITAYDGFNPAATGASNQSFLDRMPELREMGENQRSGELGKRAWQFVVQNPGRAAYLVVAKIARTWSPMPLSAEYGTWKHVTIGLLFAVPFDLLIVIGLRSSRLDGRAKLLLLLPAIYFTVVHAMTVGSLRYRIPCEPLLAVVAAAGGLLLLHRVTSKPTIVVTGP